MAALGQSIVFLVKFAARIVRSVAHARRAIAVLAVFTIATACTPSERTRPYGYLRVAPLSAIESPYSFFLEQGLLIRRDARGLSAMSTFCTYDLSKLVLKRGQEGLRFESQLTTSQYAFDGSVLRGPAKRDLPYFKVVLDAAVYGGPKNTVYVFIGREVPPSWRLTLPAQESAQQN